MPDYPPGKGLDPSVWTDARAGKLDNLDATVSSRADGANYTAARAAHIDRLADMEKHLAPTEGTATFATGDTYPKTVTIIDTSGSGEPGADGKQHLVDGYIDLTALANGESVKITESMLKADEAAPSSLPATSRSSTTSLPPSKIRVRFDNPARFAEFVLSFWKFAPVMWISAPS